MIILKVIIQFEDEVFPGLIPDDVVIPDLPQSHYPA